MRRASTGLAGNLAVSAASLAAFALAWLAAEALLHRAMPRYLERLGFDDIGYLHERSDVYGWAPRRSFRLRGEPVTTINRLGYRGPEFEGPPAPGHRRVVLLGDSVAFGYGVADGETFAAELMHRDSVLEVVNLSVQGYGTDQELIRLEHEGFAYRPDVVLLAFCMANDWRDNASPRSLSDPAFPKPYFTLEQDRLVLHDTDLRMSAADRLALYLHQRSILFNWARSLLRPQPAAEPAGPEVEPAPELTQALLRRMDERSRRHGARLVVALFPNLREFHKRSHRADLVLEDPGLAAATVVELLPRYQARGFDEASFDRYSRDGVLHLTPVGHRLTAQILADALR